MNLLFPNGVSVSHTTEHSIERLFRLGYGDQARRLKACGTPFPCSDRLHCESCKSSYYTHWRRRLEGAIRVMRHPVEIRFKVRVRDLRHGLKFLTAEFRRLRARRCWRDLDVLAFGWAKHPGRRFPDGTWEPHLHVFADVGNGFPDEGAIRRSWERGIAKRRRRDRGVLDPRDGDAWEGQSPESPAGAAEYVARPEAFAPTVESDEEHDERMNALKGLRLFGIEMKRTTPSMRQIANELRWFAPATWSLRGWRTAGRPRPSPIAWR